MDLVIIGCFTQRPSFERLGRIQEGSNLITPYSDPKVTKGLRPPV